MKGLKRPTAGIEGRTLLDDLARFEAVVETRERAIRRALRRLAVRVRDAWPPSLDRRPRKK